MFLAGGSGRWVLLVRAGGVRLFRDSRRGLRPALDFASDPKGIAGLRRYLERNPAPPVHLLVDVVEEDFRRETAPHVFGPARRTILSTRSTRLFHETPYVFARREGRAREGRRDDRIFFSAIVRPERIEPWMEVLREHGVAVAGIHSLPIASARLLPLLGAEKGRVLLVTESGARDLRQSVFEDGRLTLSRLASLPPDDDDAARGQRIVQEIGRILDHFGRSGRSAEGLQLRLVADAAVLDAIRESGAPWATSGGLVERALVERRIGRGFPDGASGRERELESGCDRVFARLALSPRLANHYAPAAGLAIYRTRRLARGLRVGGIATLLAGAAWSGISWHRAEELAARTGHLVQEARRYEARSEAQRRPEPPVAMGDVRMAVEAAERLESDRVGALPIFRAVSRALSGFPLLRLEMLEWFEISDRDRWPSPGGEDAARERRRVVHLRGRLDPFDGHHRAATDEVFRFADSLESQPRLSEVEVTESPRPPAGTRFEGGQEAGFELRMVVDAGAH